MKKIGLIGGMSWESSLVYYKLLNEKIKATFGGFQSCRCILESVDFAEIAALQEKNDWVKLSTLMVTAAKNLEAGQADLIVLCTNTMHECSDAIEAQTTIPFLHIATATAESVLQKKVKKIVLLGTRFTMEMDFYKVELNRFGIEVIIPNKNDRNTIHDIIYKELVQGLFLETSRVVFQKIIEKSILNGAEGVVLGCTEIPLLIRQKDVEIPVFDTTEIHVEYALGKALNK